MAKLKNSINLETAFGNFTVDEIIGEGGSGRVYGGLDSDGTRIALKALAADKATKDKKKRFKNEINFLIKNPHKNLVSILDHGASTAGEIIGPFYVMPRYEGNLRNLMDKGISPGQALKLFSGILDGVEAAHLKNVTHRDLKPENILYTGNPPNIVIADFGAARFSEELLLTAVETGAAQRLANFQYAAPEQRVRGRNIDKPADIFALGLILNELFTGTIPQGTGYKLIAAVSPENAFLDGIVEAMIRQEPEGRPQAITDVKILIARYHAEVITKQRISEIDETVINAAAIDTPLATEPPNLVNFDWDGRNLTLILDRPVTREWIEALHHMGNYAAVGGKPPQAFQFRGNEASISARENEIQLIIDYFKRWLPMASQELRNRLELATQRKQAEERRRLEQERQLEEQRLRVLKNIKI